MLHIPAALPLLRLQIARLSLALRAPVTPTCNGAVTERGEDVA
jgi:hypothetical protein